MIGFLLDNFIGPLLALLGIIEIQENGDWVVRRRKKEEAHYNKEEKKDRPSFFKKISGDIESLWPKRKKKMTGNDKEEPELVLPKVPLGYPGTYEKKKEPSVKRIPKMEGLALAKAGVKRICLTDRIPSGSDVEKDVLYIVQGAGEPIAYSGPLAGIRKDGYYIYDPENESWDELGGLYGWKD